MILTSPRIKYARTFRHLGELVLLPNMMYISVFIYLEYSLWISHAACTVFFSYVHQSLFITRSWQQRDPHVLDISLLFWVSHSWLFPKLQYDGLPGMAEPSESAKYQMSAVGRGIWVKAGAMAVPLCSWAFLMWSLDSLFLLVISVITWPCSCYVILNSFVIYSWTCFFCKAFGITQFALILTGACCRGER